MPDNDKQAEALIAALAPKIAEAILPQIAEAVEGQIKGVVAKNGELLDKLAKAKDDDHRALIEQTERLLKSAQADQRARLNADGTFNARKPGDAVLLKKSDARNVKAYRAAKALAEKEGVPLQIVAD